MGLRMKDLIFLGFTEKSDFYGGGVHEKPIYRGDCLNRGAWTVCRFNGWTWQEREGGVFEGSWYPNIYYE